MEFLGSLPWDPAILDADSAGTQPYADLSRAPPELSSLVESIGPVNRG
jgi:hypothetical protein